MNKPTTRVSSLSRNEPKYSFYSYVAAILGLLGAFFWAIRGTSGYGGSQGGLLAGVGWAIVWYYFANRGNWGVTRPYAAPRVLAAITFGIAFGGLTGYGVYIAWLRGSYYLDYPDTVRTIAPWTGYAMLFLCGLHWGGITGAFLAWCAPRRPVLRNGWIMRILLGIAGAVVASVVVRMAPHWFLPFYGEGLYEILENRTSIRAMRSLYTIAPHMGLFLGFLAFEIGRRDWRAVGMMAVLSVGFAIPFSLGGYWQTLYGSTLHLDWWKNWEMSIGLGGGLSFGLAFFLFNRPESTSPSRESSPAEMIWGGVVPLSLAGCSVVINACKGVVDIHNLDVPNWAGVTGASLWVLLFALIVVWWIVRIRRGGQDGAISTVPLVVVFGLVVLGGYLVSIPLPLSFGNKVLLALYTLYLGASLVLFWLTRKPSVSGGMFVP